MGILAEIPWFAEDPKTGHWEGYEAAAAWGRTLDVKKIHGNALGQGILES